MSTQAERFAKCVKEVTRDFRPASLPRRSASKKRYTSTDKESIAIAICTKSILWPQGRTMKRFYMKDGKPMLFTQPRRKTAKKSARSKK